MKKLIFTILLPFSFFLFGCNNDINLNDPNDYNAPAVPQGVMAFNGDNEVEISWTHNREKDIDGYNVYYSTSYNGQYNYIGTTSNNYYVDREAVNGKKYYYAVTAFDFQGNESELSLENAYGVARPEGFNQALANYRVFPNNSGFSFTDYKVYPYDSNNSDFFFENFEGEYYLNVWDDSDIQDLGATQDIYDVRFAPITGWNTTKDARAIVGHTYVIWTFDNRFAKIRISAITADRVIFDWAFQTLEGERMLKKNFGTSRAPLTRTFRR